MSVLRIAVRKFDAFESAIQKQFAAFKAASAPDLRLEFEALELNELHEALFGRRGLANGTWDIAFLPTDWLAEAQASGSVEDLKPWLERAPIADFPGAWSPSLLALQAFAGGFWGMPYHDGPECLIYRKDLMEEAGLQVPRTWTEFHDAARRLHAPEQGRYGTTLALYPDGHNGFYDFCIHIWSRGGEPFDAEGRPYFTSPQAHAALDFLRSLAKDERAIAPGAHDLDSVKSGLLFCEGKVALMANWFGFAALGDTWAESQVKGLIDVAPLPAAEGGRSASLNVFWVLAIGAGSNNKAPAWDFLRHLASAPMDKLTTTEGTIGVRRSTWSDPDVNRTIPYYHKLEALHAHARELPLHPKLAAISHVVDELMGQATKTDRPTSELLTAAQQRVEAVLR